MSAENCSHIQNTLNSSPGGIDLYSLNDSRKDKSNEAYLRSDSWGMIFEIFGPCLKY